MGSRCLFVTIVRGNSRVAVPPASTMPFMAAKRSSGAGDREMIDERHYGGMTVRDRRIDRALVLARTLAESSRREIRQARITAGLSRVDVGRAVGVSASQVDRFERGTLRNVR